MSETEHYSIAELEERTGQLRRTIHHYISRGLLPKAEGTGPKAFYTREHYLRLRLITLLVEAGVGTDLIQNSLQGWSAQDMERLVELAEGQSIDDLDQLGDWLTHDDTTSPAHQIAQDLNAWQESFELTAETTMLAEPAQQRMELGYGVPEPPAASPQSSRAPLPRPVTWERIRIGEDLEVAYRAKGDRRTRLKIKRLVELLRELFAEELQPPR